MDEPRRIESSLRAVGAVGSVVSAVWALARAQLPRVEEAVAQTATYLSWLDRVVDEIAGPPLPEPPGRSLVIVLGPERAFCGDLAQRLLDAAPSEGPIGLVGTRLIEVAERGTAPSADVRLRVPGPAGIDELAATSERVAAALLEALDDAGEPLRVELLAPSDRRGGVSRELLLPTLRGTPRGERDLFSQGEEVARAAARESVVGHLRAGLVGALLVETRARAAVAERARSAVRDREAELRTALRVVEQERITHELIELASAAEVG